MQEQQFEGNRGNSAESTTSELESHSTKFHIKIRKPHFKLQKVLFKRGLERYGVNKIVLEFDVERDDELFFYVKPYMIASYFFNMYITLF